MGLDEVADPHAFGVVLHEGCPTLTAATFLPRTLRMYFWIVRLLTLIPSLSSSPRMRVGNRLLTPGEPAVRPANGNAPVERRERLGGLLNFYYRPAA
ncbi:MAG TPA: hypothetical protein VF516_02605 [Kofleriaceae bacterium]